MLKDTQVHRQAEAPRAGLADRLWHRATGEARDLRRTWTQHVLAAGHKAAARHGARAIVVTLGPYECLPAALALGRALRLPVIADLRDPWALDEMRSYSHRLQAAYDAACMQRQLAQCAFVVMNTPAALAMLHQAVPQLPRERTACITNGYDGDDFASAPPDVRRDGRCRIVHAGSLHTDLALAHERRSRLRSAVLGGGRAGVDLFGRTHRYLLRAIERLSEQDPRHAARIELHLHGVLSPADQDEVRRSRVAASVRTFGYQPHGETIAAMRAADVLFLPMQGLARGQRASIVPGKAYEYLASGRPVLAAVPDGDAKDFVAAADAGVTVAPDDVDGMAAALRRFAAAGHVPDRPLGPSIQRFERRRLAAQLADVVQRTIAAL
jgi:glycosyltransferase involved in cell wall biosynthesis